jgi:serine protease SohB
MDVVFEVLGFAGKALVVFVTFTACALVLFGRLAAGRGRDRRRGRLKVVHLNQELEAKVEGLRSIMMDGKAFKKHRKERAAARKKAVRLERRVFVLDFHGDLMASAVESLRDEVTAIVGVAQPDDEVVLRLESGGGAAHSYGFAASQLARLGDAKVSLTVCIDRVAASGGYMMACVADKIVAAPFAIVGSIGVAAPLPNVHRLLERVGVDYENATAGRYKRTVSPFTKVDPQGREKFQDDIEELHKHFKAFVGQHRPALDVDEVATGESWQAVRATELGLVDELMTSDDYLMRRLPEAELYELELIVPSKMRQRLSGAASALVDWGLTLGPSRGHGARLC